MRSSLCLPIVLVLLAVAEAPAQTRIDGAILGVVTDVNGGRLGGAMVAVTNLDTGLTKSMLTDPAGNFEITPLPNGNYSVTVTFTGFKSWTLARVELTIGERKRLEPVLEVGGVNEKVTVEATAELLQTERAETGAVVEERTIRELPLNGRNVVELAALVPGVRYEGKTVDAFNGPMSNIQGVGHRNDQTEFQVDGIASNSEVDEGGTAIPNPDTVAQFNVATSNFSAANGRNPVLVSVVTKSGTNEFHGALWEFLRNDALDARNAFAVSNPKLRRNQFGAAAGGPIIKNRTFFFGSYEGTRIRSGRVFNSPTVPPAYLKGDFSGAPPIKDPVTGQPFPGNQIPQSRFSPAAVAFFPWILQPNSAGNLFRANFSIPLDFDEYTARIDHQITAKQRIYVRYLRVQVPQTLLGYRPDITGHQENTQYSLALNYDYAITPRTLFNFSVGTVNNHGEYNPTCCEIGQRNLTQDAGIQGFQTAGREKWIGLPDVISFGPYTGITSRVGWGPPGSVTYQNTNGNVSINFIRGQHSIVAGYQYLNLYGVASHGSCCSRGTFSFNGQYTGDAFADYLLGLPNNSGRNFPLQTFGVRSNPYGALFAVDSWKVTPRLSLELGIRWDHWFARSYVRGNASTFDPKTGKAIAAMDKNGKVDLTAQPAAVFLAKATAGLWVSAAEAGVPSGLFEPTGYVSPRVGIAWRPLKGEDLVVRSGFGVFVSGYRGNIIGSQIVGPPYWGFESQSWSPSQLQRWESAWPADPTSFVAPSISAAAYNVKPNKDYEWNVSVQKSLPHNSAITLAYVGSKGDDLIAQNNINEVPPGRYTDLQAAKPYPIFGPISLYINSGRSWYNSLQTKVEKRYSAGLSFMLSYAYSKSIAENGASGVWDIPTPFAPAGYNRGRSNFDYRHILATNAIWDVPVGRGRKFGNKMNPVANAVIGGWELTGIYLFSSGSPLTFTVQGATLGNGWGTRANLVGDPHTSSPSAARWFNPAAFAAPPTYQFGNSGIGIMDGPARHVANLGLMKKFQFTEQRYLQFRWEAFNAFNHTNLSNPNTTIGQSTTGQIFSAGDARQMQIGLRFVF